MNQEKKLIQKKKESADIIHQIGLIYKKRSPDKISLLQSVGLFNAAIVRNPFNTQIKSDLSETCRDILKLANTNYYEETDLVKKAEDVKKLVNELREQVDALLQKLLPKIAKSNSKEDFYESAKNKIDAVKQINKTIAEKYKEIMIDLCIFCEEVMGKPSCPFAVVGMGSLAREETTPYSDFEHIILLSDKENYQTSLEHFRWFSVIFHVIILNVKETIIPSLNVRSLNDKNSKLQNWFYDAITPRGISFDDMMPHACKFPLGRQQLTRDKQFTTELIKPVNEMLEYLTSEEDLKNGYHLADILTKTCFVYGNEEIFKKFESGVQNYLSKKSDNENVNDVKREVEKDLRNFSIRTRLNELKLNDTINIKQLVYRSVTIFIAALARIHNISANSCFDIVDNMKSQSKITQYTADKLQFSIAIACEIRLRVYTKKQSQLDNAFNLHETGIKNFLDIVGVPSTLNYFQTAYSLQCEVAKQLLLTKLHFYSEPRLINITIGLVFKTPIDLSCFSFGSLPKVWNSKDFNFDHCIKTLESQSNNSLLLSENSAESFFFQKDLNADRVEDIANKLKRLNCFDEAVEFYKNLLKIYQKHNEFNNTHSKFALVKNEIGFCLNKLRRLDEALDFLKQAYEIKEMITANAKKDNSIAKVLHDLADCYIKLEEFEVAFEYLNRSLVIKQNITTNAKKDRNISATIHTIGYCYKKKGNYHKALEYFHQALKINRNAAKNAEEDRGIASNLHEIG